MNTTMSKTMSPQVISLSQVISPQQVSEDIEYDFQDDISLDEEVSYWFSADAQFDPLEEEINWFNQLSSDEETESSIPVFFPRPLQIPSMASERKIKEEAEEKKRAEMEATEKPKTCLSTLVGRVLKPSEMIAPKVEEQVKEIAKETEVETSHFSMKNVDQKVLSKVFGSRRQQESSTFQPKTQAEVIAEIKKARRDRKNRCVKTENVVGKSIAQVNEEAREQREVYTKTHQSYDNESQKKKSEEQAQRFLESQKMEVVIIRNATPSPVVEKKEEAKTEPKVEKKDDGFTEVKSRSRTSTPVEPKVEKIELGFFVADSKKEKIQLSEEEKKAKLVKSNMCRIAVETGKCHRAECNFAHTIAELNPYQCEFGSKCKFFTSEIKKCNHFHPSETKDSYCARRGIKEYKAPVEKAEIKKVEISQPVKIAPTPVCEGDRAKFWSAKTESLRKEAEVNPRRIAQSPVTVTPVVSVATPVMSSPSSTQLVKSKMCMNILNYGSCNRSVCNFAHTLEELTPSRCNWGSSCRHMHNQERPCVFIHDGESKEGWLQRTNLYPQLKPVSKPAVKIAEKPVEKPVEKRKSRWDVLAEPEPVVVRVTKGVDPRTVANLVSSSQIPNVRIVYEK